MSPQPAAVAAKAKKTDAERAAERKQMAERIAAVTSQGTDSAQRQIQRALDLESTRADLQESIGKNRTYLRLMDSNEELTGEQRAWLADFYPDKEKGATRSPEEIEATRKAKEAARVKTIDAGAGSDENDD